MTKAIHKHEVAYAKTEEGKYLVASVTGPTFLFCEDTYEEARDTAQRALNFYFSENNEAPRERVSKSKRVIGFVPTKREELVAA
jgi:predicted RNase H-like HicB family nuclease